MGLAKTSAATRGDKTLTDARRSLAGLRVSGFRV